MSRTYGYDAAGNTTSYSGLTFGYNDAGRMTSVSGGATATYAQNALGQRVKKVTGGATTYFVYDEAGHLVGEYDGAGALIQETVWLGDIPVATLRPNGGSVAVYYVHTDHLNTPRRISRPADNVIVWRWDSDPFGTTAASQDPDGDSTNFVYHLRFPGQYYDAETGLNYNLARDYDPQTGRYVESDPIGLRGGNNTYGYVLSNPVEYSDPLGLATKMKPPSRPKLTKDQCSMDCQTLYQALIRVCQSTGYAFFACKAEVDQLLVECVTTGKPPECTVPKSLCQNEELRTLNL